MPDRSMSSPAIMNNGMAMKTKFSIPANICKGMIV